jgi:hypothetical protein
MRSALASHLDAQPWQHETGTVQCLGFTFTVRTTDATLGRMIGDLYEPCATSAAADHRYDVRERRTSGGVRIVVYHDGVRLVTTSSASIALDHLVWDVNRRAIDAAERQLLLHAGAVSRNGAAVLFPAPSGAGKSTLVAGLVQRGFDYVTDEAVAIDPRDATADAYPKPIALERGSWHLFPTDFDATRYTTLTHYRTAASLGGRAVSGRVVPRLVVAPRYVPDGPGAVRSLQRAEAVMRLADQSFNFDTFGPGRLHLLARVVEGCACYELDVHDLGDAATTVRTLLDDAVSSAR